MNCMRTVCPQWWLCVGHVRVRRSSQFLRSVNLRTAAHPAHFQPPGSMLVLAALHEMETVKALLDSALAQVQATLY